jgi:hypothetical protein
VNNFAVETLFLPAAGYRRAIDANLYSAGGVGGYWSSSFSSVASYDMNFGGNYVNPADLYHRAYGYSIRCIRN